MFFAHIEAWAPGFLEGEDAGFPVGGFWVAGNVFPIIGTITYQYLRPISDIADGGWKASSGPDLYAMLDETVASDADYIYSPDNPTTQQFEFKLSSGGKPPLGSAMLIKIRFQAMELNTTFDIDVVENTTVKDSWTEAVTVAAGMVERQHTVASAVVDGMTDFTNIRVRGVARA